MTNLPQVFKGQQVRIVMRDEEPWWVAKDVCDVLELTNSRKATSQLDEDEKGVTFSNTPSGKQEMTVINESGLYTLILRSNKPIAKELRRWVTHEVLPAIRKSGNYGVADTRHLVESVAEPLKKENEELKSKVIALLEEKIERQSKELREVKKARRSRFPRKSWNTLEKAEVMRLYEAGYPPREIAPRFGVSNGAISDLIRKRSGGL